LDPSELRYNQAVSHHALRCTGNAFECRSHVSACAALLNASTQRFGVVATAEVDDLAAAGLPRAGACTSLRSRRHCRPNSSSHEARRGRVAQALFRQPPPGREIKRERDDGAYVAA
jgi:hypothetical protein